MTQLVHKTRRKRPKQARSRATVEAIQEAGSQVLVRDGYAKLITTRVAERAGVSVGTLYQYFASKDELVRALAERQAVGTFEALAGAAKATEGQGIRERIRAMLSSLLAMKSKDPAFTSAIASAMLELEGKAWLARTMGQTEILVAGLLEAHRHELGPLPDLAPFVIVRSVEGVMGSLVVDPPRPLGDPSLVDALERLVLGYLGVTVES